MSDINETRHCFRCKGLSVIDPSALKYLPSILDRAASTITWAMESVESTIDREEWYNLGRSLREYAILVESAMRDD